MEELKYCEPFVTLSLSLSLEGKMKTGRQQWLRLHLESRVGVEVFGQARSAVRDPSMESPPRTSQANQ